PWTNRPPGGPARPPSLPQPSIRALRRAGCPRAARTAAAVRRQRPAPRAAAFVRHARKRRRPAAVPRSCASVPSPCPTQLRRNRSRKPALSEARQPRLSVGVRLVLGQKILCLQRPLAVDAGLLRHRDRLAQRLGGLVLQRKRLRLQRAPVEFLLLRIEPARHRRVEQALVEVPVRLADAGERRLAPARAAD